MVGLEDVSGLSLAILLRKGFSDLSEYSRKIRQLCQIEQFWGFVGTRVPSQAFLGLHLEESSQ